MDWNMLLVSGVPVAELMLRGTLVYLALLLLLRVVGRRESGGLGINDVLVVVLLAEAVAGGLTAHTTGVLGGLVVAATILAWSLVIDALSYRFPKVSALLKAQPRTLIRRGQVEQHVARRELLTAEEIATQLRLHGIHDLSEVEHAYLEPNGMISVVRKDAAEPDEPVHRPML